MSATERIFVTSAGDANIGDPLAATLRDAGHDVVRGPADLADHVALRAALGGVSRVFLDAVGTDVHLVTTTLVAADVRSVVVLSDAVVELAAEFDVFGYRHLEAAVRASGVAYTFLRPTDLAANALRWADQFQQATTVAAPYLDAYQEPVDEHDLVDAAVAALTDGRHQGRAYLLSGPHSLTRRELIDIVARAADRSVEIIAQAPQQWQAAAVAAGIPAPAAHARLATWRAAVGRPGRTDVTITAVTGAAPPTFTAWAERHRAEFTMHRQRGRRLATPG
jgi:uncharacterized protein YbjT (DUF2867 family)